MASHKFHINTKGLVSAAIVAALAVALAGGSVESNKMLEIRRAEQAAAAAEAERKAHILAAGVFVPVMEVSGLAMLDVGEDVPGIYAMEDAKSFNADVKYQIEKREAEELAKAEAEKKAKEEEERRAQAEANRQESQQSSASGNAANNSQTSSDSNSTSSDSSQSGTDSGSSEQPPAEEEPEQPSGGSRDVSVLYNYVGCPYAWGGTSPSGWDCSGFVQYVMKNEFGVSVSRTASGQASNGSSVPVSDRSQWKPGDLLIYRSGSGSIGHVGIYLGNGMMIHALNEKHGTFTQSVSTYEGWDSNTLVKVRRVLN